MKRYSSLFILLFTSSLAIAQQCSCEQKFLFIKHEIETNYAGYADKVNPKTRKAYDKLTAETLVKVKKTKNEAYCLYALRDWTKFFNDGHVQLFDPRQPDMNDTAAIRQRVSAAEVIKLSPERLKALGISKDHEEGLYYSPDSSYKIAIIKSKNEFRDYVGVMVESKVGAWSPGQVKLELQKENDSLYKAILFMRDHSPRLQHYYFNGSSFDGGNWNKIGKRQPVRAGDPKRFQFKKVQAEKLSDSTLYIQVGTFSPSNARAIDSLFTAFSGTLITTPNLILDLRNNGGGGDESYAPILPYIYTDPIIGYGNLAYATKDNAARYREDAKDPDLSDGIKKRLTELADDMDKAPGKFILHASDDTMMYAKVLPYPRRVVVLINGNCASSTEEFLLAAKQSGKVTLVGQHTYGELDYSNWLNAPSPCKDMEFHYSTTKSNRIPIGKGIDGKGINPNILLSNDKDWIKEAQAWLEKPPVSLKRVPAIKHGK